MSHRGVSQPSMQDLQAEVFQDLYYKTMDFQRPDTCSFYKDDSTLLWNGNRYKGLVNVQNFFKLMPASKHTVLSYDSQSISSSGTPAGLFVVVSGRVAYGRDKEGVFNQTFVLMPDTSKSANAFYICSDTMRFTEDS